MCLFSTNASVSNTGCDELVCGTGLAEKIALCIQLGKRSFLRVLNSPVPRAPLVTW